MMGTTGLRLSATVRYPDPEQNLVWRNVVATETPFEVSAGDDSSCVADRSGQE